MKNTEKHNALTAESGMYTMILLLFLMIFLSVLFLIFHVRNLKKEKIFLRMNQELTGLPNKHSLYKDIQNRPTAELSRKLIESIIYLCKKMNLCVVAEVVEKHS